MARSVKKAFRWPEALVVALYVGSFFAPAYMFFGPNSGWEAFWTVTQGIGNAFTGNINPAYFGKPREVVLGLCLHLVAWLPNPLVWAGVCALLAGRRHLPWVLGAVALVCALVTWALWTPGRFLIGFYLWLASMGLLTAVGVRRLRRPPEPGFVDDPAGWTRASTSSLSDPPRQEVQVSKPGPDTRVVPPWSEE